MAKQRVIVTGGAANIGLAIARAFAQNGAKVHLCDIDPKALADATRDGQLVGAACDITDAEQVARYMDEAIETMGGLDVLVSNIGLPGPTLPLELIELADWQKVLNVNLTGGFLMSRAAIPHLKRSGSGTMIFMSSVSGRMGHPNRSPYATTKWGLIGLAKTLARELGPYNIRVNAILPGAVDNKRARKVLLEITGSKAETEQEIEQVVRDNLAAHQSIARLVPMEEIGALAVFLASDGGRSISGQMIPIDADMRA
ncbi:SDR family oxidoreductase [Bradyrhizobium commune]|uniref:SDR family oxidoreductase n=1 Tax=Bradyrhizobium commune TaxID=83627 RepID=A0A7S9D430_9BRAD|nr:SDR family oxidoreductase [Bradyrhizobium commune]QPF90693.1 SDR family oxidoreductase [Bradyrhizobium commune]